MTLQALFDTTINLLTRQGHAFVYAMQLLDHFKSATLTFNSFDKPSPGTTKAGLLNIYERREKFEKERQENTHVFGYDTLMPNLRATKQDFICVSSFMTEVGTFIVFSDFDRTELMGCLLTKTLLQQTRDKMNEHKRLVESTGNEVAYDYEQNENVFVNGQLQFKESA